MRTVLLDPRVGVLEVNGKTIDAIRRRIFHVRDCQVNSLCIRRADNRQAAVIAYGYSSGADNAELHALIEAESRRRAYVPTEFLIGETMAGRIMLVVETADDGVASLSRRQYRELRAGGAGVLSWLECPKKGGGRLKTLVESPQRL